MIVASFALVAFTPATVASVQDKFTKPVSEPLIVSAPPAQAWIIPTQTPVAIPNTVAPLPQQPPVAVAKVQLGANTLSIPSVGIQSPIGTMDWNKNRELLAPYENPNKVYRWVQKGTIGVSKKAVYVVGHSCRSPNCEYSFNRLQQVELGQKIFAADTAGVTHTYTVTRMSNPAYEDLSKTGVWDWNGMPNTLVLLACQLRGDGAKQTNNFVVWASLDS